MISIQNVGQVETIKVKELVKGDVLNAAGHGQAITIEIIVNERD